MRIAFIVVSFPAVSETFVLNQITGLIDLGHEVEIFAGSCPQTGENTIKPCREPCRTATEEEQRSTKLPSKAYDKGEDDSVNSSPSVRHADVDRYGLMAHTRCYNDMPTNRLWRIVKALWLALKYGHKNPSAVFRSLNVFKYGREALSLNLFYKVILFLSVGEFDILYCQFGSNGNLGALLKELGIRGKLATMFHGSDIRRGIEEGPGIYRKLMEQGDCFLSISSYNYKHLVEFGVDERKIVSHHVGIDLARYPYRESRSIVSVAESSNLRQEPCRKLCRKETEDKSESTIDKARDKVDDKEESIRILTVARLAKEKGLEYGIRAIGRLVTASNLCREPCRNLCRTETEEEQKSTKLTSKAPAFAKGQRLGTHDKGPVNFLRYQIIGDGPLETELKALVAELGLADIVEFLGPQDSGKVAEYLQNADLFLLPSLAEATPVSLMEAQAVGLPVVATRVGSVDEVVVDGKSGFLVPPGNVDALAERLQYLIEHPDLWPAMGRTGRSHVEQHYDVKKLNERLAELFAGMRGNKH